MKISVDLPQKSYDIVIEKGALVQVGRWVSQIWQHQKIVIITDSNVNKIYGQKVLSALTESGFEAKIFEFPAGEASKGLATAEAAWNICGDFGLTRSDGIIGLGGGVAGDLAGFVASTYMRGIHFLQIATSLTAQVDSSVGGKTGVNSSLAKNMIGTFAQPDGVLIDPEMLATLDRRCLIEGMGEVIKCGLIADKELWDFLSQLDGPDAILENAETLIAHAIEVKRQVVVADEHDNSTRLYLNFGHTIGHAVEATAGYGQVMHGEAVAIGMVQISKIAEQKGLMPVGITQQIRAMVTKFGLPADHQPWDEAKLYQALTHDKKARGSQIKTVIVPQIGTARINQVALEEMWDYLKK